MRRRQVLFVLLALLLPAGVGGESVSGEVTLDNIRHQVYPTHTRVVMDFNQAPLHTIDRSTDSKSISIHLPNTVLGATLQENPILLLQGALEKIEVKEEEDEGISVLLTFRDPRAHKAMVLTHPDRLVLDVTHPEVEGEPDAKEPGRSSALPPQPPPPSLPKIRTIVIDPGHGGEAPGATGPTGLTEAEVVLDVSLRLTRMIEERLGKKVILTRDRDIFITLQERTEIANTNKADLFVSVHANASRRKSAQGIETYLFGRATDEMALQTAARENATDVKTAQNFQEAILNDLLRDFTINEALELAHYTQDAFVKTLIPEYPTPSLGVKKAPFYVLAHTDMPAILAEISFVSNKIEEKRLRQSHYRRKIAESIFKGIKEYIAEKEKS